ncbi:MAG: enoyl-CoA hydratase/isomerase family protein [Thermoanaerobaculia bacterium]
MPRITFSSDTDAHRITLSDPPLNILDIPMLDELREALGRVRADRHVLIIDAVGTRAFSAGVAVQDHLGDRARVMLTMFHDCFRILARLEVVTVALVRGLALGGGCELAMACDFILASESAKFGQPEIRLGVFPPVGAWQLSRQLPPRKGLEMMLTGEPVDASLIANAVFADDDFEADAEEWLARIYGQSASSLRIAKKAFRLAQVNDFEERLATIERLYLEELMRTDDANEGLNAFLEKRAPRWR